MKKLAVLAALVLVMGLFAGCSPAEAEKSTPPPPAESLEPVNLAALVDAYKGVYAPEDLSGEALFTVQEYVPMPKGIEVDVVQPDITAEGSYRVSGEVGDILIGTAGTVQLILDGATISGGIFAEAATKLIITVESDSSIDVTGATAISAVCDVTINGGGSLTITATAVEPEEGMWAMPPTAIYSGGSFVAAIANLTVESEGTGISAFGSANMHSGNYIINTPFYSAIGATGDVHIDGGNLTVLDAGTGISGANVYITDGVVDITATGTGIVANGEMMSFSGFDTSDFGSGETGDAFIITGDGDATLIAPADGQQGDTPDGTFFGAVDPENMPEGDLDGAIEMDPNMLPDGEIDSSFGMTGGTTGDWGSSDYERPEINADLRIVGGIVTVHAEREALASNGSVYIDGGEVYASVSIDGGGAALSYGNEALITGGTAVLVGGQTGAMGFSTSSTQYSFLANLPGQAKNGTLLNILDGSNNVIAKMTPAYNYQSVVFSSPKLKENGVYTLVAGTLTAKVTITQMSEGSDNWTPGGRSGRGGPGGFFMAPGQMQGMIGQLAPGERRTMVGPNGEQIEMFAGEAGDGSVGFSIQGGMGGTFDGNVMPGGEGNFVIGEAGGGAVHVAPPVGVAPAGSVSGGAPVGDSYTTTIIGGTTSGGTP